MKYSLTHQKMRFQCSKKV